MYDDLPDDHLHMLINLNVLHVAYFIKAMVDQLEKRSSRSGIVITSSVAADYPIPGGITYSCAKRYVTDLAIGLNYELKDKIDEKSLKNPYTQPNFKLSG